MLGINSGSSTKLNRKNVESFWLKLKSSRVSNAFRFSLNTGELAKFEKRLELFGCGERFKSLIALGSRRLAGRTLRPQPVSVKAAVLGPQVPNGSRTKPTCVPGV